jgi:predicted ATPase/class 3 adenylate cyclase
MQCLVCKHENPAAAKFCLECGARLGLICSRCNNRLPAAAKFCFECGNPVAPGAPVQSGFASPDAYTPKFLAEKILTSRTALEGERKVVTVLFADIKGSMEVLEGRDPEEARALLDPALHTMMEAVHRYEGTVNQVLGDGIMALFGAPLAHEDHAIRAGYAALRMQEQIAAYASQVLRRHGVGLQIRVGLNAGEVVVRGIGNDLAMEYSAVGQTTHLAARMEQLASPGTILATEAVARLAGEYLRLKPLGPIPVKGLADPVEVFEVVGTARPRTRLEAAVARGLTPFVGRQNELRGLIQVLEQARAGHGQVVALVGEPGIGKSRLYWEFAHSLDVQGWLLLEGMSFSYGKATAYLPVVDLLKAYFQIDDRDDARRMREKVVGKLLALDEALTATASALLALLGVPVEDMGWQALDPHQRGQRTLDALKRLLLRESQVRPLVLVFENLHWTDTATQAFLDGLVESLPMARLLLLVTYRPEYQHTWGSKSYYTQLRIDPLPAENAEELLRALLGDASDMGPVITLLIERTGGNPLFLEESVRTLVETKALVGERGAYRLASSLQTIQVPATVQALLAARIDRAPAEAKRLLQSAAVIGKQVPFALLEAISDLPEEALRRALADLQAAEFLYEASLFPETLYAFKHNLTSEVAYTSLLHERRRALHARIVEALEALPADRLREQIERLAHHAFRGEVWGKAVVYLQQAGTKALTRSANREAVAYFEQALTALQHLPVSREVLQQAIDVRFDLVAPLLQLGRLQEVLSLLRETESVAERLGDEQRLARAFSYLVNYSYLTGEPGLAIEYGERCVAIGEARKDPGLEILARRYMGHSYHAQGQYRQAESILLENLEMLEASRDADGTVQDMLSYVASCGWLAFTMADLGEFDQAQAYADKALRIAETSHHVYTEAIAWTLGALVWIRRGYPRRAVQPLERSLQACTENYLPLWRPVASSLLGLALVFLGPADEALHLLEEGVALSEELGIKAYLALWTTHLAEGLLAAGQMERALATAQQALDLARAHKERGHQAWAFRLLGEIVSQGGSGKFEQAEDHYHQAMALAGELGMRPLLALTHLGLGRLYRRENERSKAEEHLTHALSLCLDMSMGLWSERSAAELKELGNLLIVASDHLNLYDFLKQEFAETGSVRVILDRRGGKRREDVKAREVPWHGSERRRQSGIPEGLRSRGFVVIS